MPPNSAALPMPTVLPSSLRGRATREIQRDQEGKQHHDQSDELSRQDKKKKNAFGQEAFFYFISLLLFSGAVANGLGGRGAKEVARVQDVQQARESREADAGARNQAWSRDPLGMKI